MYRQSRQIKPENALPVGKTHAMRYSPLHIDSEVETHVEKYFT